MAVRGGRESLCRRREACRGLLSMSLAVPDGTRIGVGRLILTP